MASSQCYELIECFHVRVKNNCKLCGVFVKEGVAAFKTERYRNTDEAYTVRYLKSLKRMARKPLAGKYPFSESLYSYLERLVEKFGADVFDESGASVGIVGQGGKAFARVSRGQGQLTVKWGPDATTLCTLRYDVSTGFTAENTNRLRHLNAGACQHAPQAPTAKSPMTIRSSQ